MPAVSLIEIALLLLQVNATRGFHQYHFILEAKTWTEAQSYCREKYTDLATVDNMEDMNRLMAASNGYSGDAWLGLAKGNGFSWQWSDGSRDVPFTNWGKIEPNNIEGNEDCVEINESGEWNDIPCQHHKYLACYDYNSKGEVVYSVHEGFWMWNDSYIHCKEAHVDMAVVLSKADNDVIRGLASNHGVWIGLYRDYWEWSDRGAIHFRYWKRDKPDNYSGEDCAVSALHEQGKWDDWPCDEMFPFFCHGPLKSKLSVVKIVIHSTSDPTELGVSEQLLQQLHVQLRNLHVSDYKLSWKVQEDGLIFQKEKERGPEQKGCWEVVEPPVVEPPVVEPVVEPPAVEPPTAFQAN